MVQSKVTIFVLHQARPFKNECLENTPINFGDVFVIFNEKTKYVLLAPHQLLTSNMIWWPKWFISYITQFYLYEKTKLTMIMVKVYGLLRQHGFFDCVVATIWFQYVVFTFSWCFIRWTVKHFKAPWKNILKCFLTILKQDCRHSLQKAEITSK